MSHTVTPRAHHATVLGAHVLKEEGGVLTSSVEITLLSERHATSREGREHQAVPSREHLVVQERMYARLTVRIERRARALNGDRGLDRIQLALLTEVSERLILSEDVRLLPVAMLRHAIPSDRDVGVCSADSLDLIQAPDEELTLNTLAVSVRRRVEAALCAGHLTQDIVEDLRTDLTPILLTGRLPSLDVDPRKLRVVIEHLLEVRYEPGAVYRIAREAAADLIVDPAARHVL